MIKLRTRQQLIFSLLAISLSACGPNPTGQTNTGATALPTSVPSSTEPAPSPGTNPSPNTVASVAPSTTPTVEPSTSSSAGTAAPAPTSSPSTGVTLPPPPLPSGLKIVEQTTTSMTLQWEFGNEPLWYRVYLDGKLLADHHTAPNYYRFDGLTLNTSYNLGIQAVSADGPVSGIATFKAITLSSGRTGVGDFSGGGSSGPRTTSSTNETVYIPNDVQFQVNAFGGQTQQFSKIAMDADGDYVAVWNGFGSEDDGGIYLRRYNSAGVAQSSSDFLVNTTTTSGNQDHAAIAMNDQGEFIVAWVSPDSDAAGIFAQLFDSAGNRVGSEFQVNTEFFTAQQVDPAVAINNEGDFVITWSAQSHDGDDYGVYGQRYTNTGSADGSEFQINSYTSGAQHLPQIQLADDGDLAVVWESTHTGSNDIYVRLFDINNQPQASEFRVNTFTDSSQHGPSVAMDAEGDFVVSWTSDYHSNDLYYSIQGQRFTRSGTKVGAEFQVNTYTNGSNSQGNPSVAMDDDGDFVVTWQSFAQDNDYFGIYARAYKNNGEPKSDEFQVNILNQSIQESPSIAMDADGDFVVSWVDGFYDYSSSGIFAVRYKSVPAPSNPVTYATVYDIFQARCSGCHSGEFIDNYSDTRALNVNIRDRVFVQQDMPDLGSDEAAAITSSERKKIADWIDQGMPNGTINMIP